MTRIEEQASRTLEAYRDSVRPFLEQNQVTGLDGLDQAADLLRAAIEQKTRISVGFVGESQVGKSSLINALLDRTTLPAGGVGPLTASATHVSYGQDPTITVAYHGKKQVQQLAFVLETHLLRSGQALGEGERTTLPDGAHPEDIPPDPRSIEGSDSGATEARDQATKKTEYLIAQAKTLLAGGDGKSSERPSISERVTLEALRAVIGFKVRGSESELQPFAPRIVELRRRLGTRESLRQSEFGSAKAFHAELRLRAAGWLSPLVESLHVTLDASVVQSLDITDLPGVGVVGDPAALAAQKFVTDGGNALVLVMRNNGMTDELARLLERAGVIRRLLFGGREGRAPIRILIAVTHLDDVARERHRQAAEDAIDAGTPAPSGDDMFRSLAVEMVAKVRQQLAVALRSSPAFEDLPVEHRARRDAVIGELVAAMHVECVAAPDYAALTYLRGVAKPALLEDPSMTGVPELKARLLALAAELDTSRDAAIEEAKQSLVQLSAGYLNSLEELYTERGGQAQAAWDSFRSDLEKIANDLKPQVAAYQGEALAVLRQEVPQHIEILCLNAEKIALKRLARLFVQGQAIHYQSLNAALLRNGVWQKRAVDYPDAITSALVDAIATGWEPEIIEAVRKTLRAWAERSVTVVEKLVAEARRRDDKIVTEAQVEAQQKILVQQSRTAVAWTKERLEALREEVQKELYDAVLKPIERACNEAVKQHKNRSAGAKQRILEAFQEGGSAAIAKATDKAREVLNKSYRTLQAELNRGFLKDNHDPVQAAFEALTSEQLLKARRSDAQKRRRVLEGVATARENLGAACRAAPAEEVAA